MPHRAIENLDQLVSVFRLLKTLKGPFTVEWRLGRDRTKDQNALQWKWAGEAAEQTGDTPADVQAEWKLRFGVPILRADSPAFRETYDRCLKALPYDVKIKAMRDLDIGVTRIMGVKQMTRYLDAVHRECASNGIELTIPEDKW